MTLRAADVPSLPLSVTCTADAVFAATIVALAARVVRGRASGAPDDAPVGPGAQRFTDAVEAGIAACLSQPSAPDGHLTVTLSSEATHWVGSLHWTAGADDAAAAVSVVEAALSRTADEVDCVQDGADARCDVRCLRD